VYGRIIVNNVILHSIIKDYNTITYQFSSSGDIVKYFSGNMLSVEYPMNIESVPASIASIPFVCSVLPIIWLTNSRLELESLDKDFFECISKVKAGYESMYPESEFLGSIEVNRIVRNEPISSNRAGAFFSGGLDAMDTLIRHLEEKPDLIAIWGADVKYDNAAGWQIVQEGIEETSKKFKLDQVVIRSSFREFDAEAVLHRDFHQQLKDGWWHGVKHGIGLLGHAAPLAYLRGWDKVYIASSNCPEDGKVRCASNPTIDNHVRFCGCQVVHDGFECSRQDKVKNIVDYCRASGNKLTLHVCWESQKGNNCCWCEKCYRTMVALIAEGAAPEDYGFEDASKGLQDIRHRILRKKYYGVLKRQWPHIQKRLIENKKIVKRSGYWKHLKWIESTDFSCIEKARLPLIYRIQKMHLIRSKLAEFRFYQKLHDIKERVKHGK